MNEIKYQPKFSYLSQFGILLSLWGIGVILAGVVSIPIWKLLTNASIFTIESDIVKPAFTNAARILQLVSSAVAFFLPGVLFAFIVNRKPLEYLGFHKVLSGKQMFYVVIITFVALFVSGALAEVNKLIPIASNWEAKFKSMEANYNKQVLAIANMQSFTEYLYVLVVIALAPAIFEEVLFRGAFQQLFVQWTKNPIAGIVITSVIFSVVHISFYGFLPRVGLGVVLGLIFFYSKNIWLCIAAHFLNNGFAVTQMYGLIRNGRVPEEALEETFPIWMGGFAIAALILCFIIFKKESNRVMLQHVIDHQDSNQQHNE